MNGVGRPRRQLDKNHVLFLPSLLVLAKSHSRNVARSRPPQLNRATEVALLVRYRSGVS